jgi:outer membrane autotransporter protein
MSQLLPSLGGSEDIALLNVMHNLNHIIQARQEREQGQSSGDVFYGDRRFWLKPFGSWANQDNRNGAAGYSADTYGMVFGADAEPSETNRIGVALAYAHSNMESTSSAAPQTARVNSYQLIGYGNHSLDDVTDINFQADVGKHDTDGHRDILFMCTSADG